MARCDICATVFLRALNSSRNTPFCPRYSHALVLGILSPNKYYIHALVLGKGILLSSVLRLPDDGRLAVFWVA